MFRILGMGNALTDVLIKTHADLLLNELGLPKGSMQLIDASRFHEINQRIAGLPIQMVSGGSAANTMVGLAKLGQHAAFLGKVHADEVGLLYLKDMRDFGVETRMLNGDLPSGQSLVFISPDGERTFATYLGASGTMTAAELSPEQFTGVDLFYVEGYLLQDHELILKAMRLAKDAGALVALDLASYNVVEANREFLRMLLTVAVDWVFANEEEAASLLGLPVAETLDWLSEQVKIAVVKRGEDGAMAREGLAFAQVSAIPSECIDTTGAGDLFAAGFIHAKAQNRPLAECLSYGAVVAGKVVEVVGSKIDKMGWDSIRNALSV